MPGASKGASPAPSPRHVPAVAATARDREAYPPDVGAKAPATAAALVPEPSTASAVSFFTRIIASLILLDAFAIGSSRGTISMLYVGLGLRRDADSDGITTGARDLVAEVDGEGADGEHDDEAAAVVGDVVGL